MKAFILMHGLPGVGKTTVCRQLAEACRDLQYVDLGKDPDFGKRPMLEICVDRYRASGQDRNLLTEGHLPKMASRDHLVRNVLSACGFDRALIVGLDEADMDFLATRRNRTSAEYASLRDDTEFGSRKFDYIRYTSSPNERNSVDERTRNLRHRIADVLGPGFGFD